MFKKPFQWLHLLSPSPASGLGDCWVLVGLAMHTELVTRASIDLKEHRRRASTHSPLPVLHYFPVVDVNMMAHYVHWAIGFVTHVCTSNQCLSKLCLRWLMASLRVRLLDFFWWELFPFLWINNKLCTWKRHLTAPLWHISHVWDNHRENSDVWGREA